LYGADLRGADLREAKNAELAQAQTIIVPEGELVVWKMARTDTGKVLVKLRIPTDAQRSNAAGRKCRASKAVVLSLETTDGNPLPGDVQVESLYDYSFVYRVGETVEPREPFDTDRWNECASGIHFYLTRIEAVNHV
ncbi:MAG: DUF5758 domain-containing protein, partial [Propionibacteriaceae bacterium]|nr:DUF5758 domain-containing protein [Propionibacteriaceae bacterium]